MTSSEQPRANYSRRFIFFALFIVLAAVGYSAAWYYAAGWVGERAGTAVAELNRDGRRASCENLHVRGYPFRLGVFCRSVMYVDASGGLAIRAGALRTAAQIYDPARALGELDGPATIELPGLTALDVDWELLRASTKLASPMPERLSVEGTNITIDPDSGRVGAEPMVAMSSGEFHMRPADRDLDVALRFSGLVLSASLLEGAQLPPLDGLVDLSLDNGLAGETMGTGLRGRSAVIRNMTVSTGEDTGVAITGPISVDATGRIDAELEVTVRNPQALADLLGGIFPESRDEIRMSFSAIAAMGETPKLPLRIEGGNIRLGFLSLGSIPAM